MNYKDFLSERMLNETDYLPKHLLMENVKALVNKKNMSAINIMFVTKTIKEK